ncbi:MAG: PQQ-binding-like beta-propeller repeat protein [Phycisphaerales bacterium]|nr:PQQ-binding-like beta-propeller repeat protein [Phycisphaerae bacterium]NNF43896.1 PQQ-binding-like beta-propeller repeat protein [Phycisphaerales bacterium]NNM25602.1 PQQ-binding-like beta-propeller repeat protein [Phycisphaerales bacterium]
MRQTPGLPDAEPVIPAESLERDPDDLVFVGLRGHVAALARDTGEIVWKWKSPKGSNYCNILLDGDCVLVGIYGYLYCLDAATGALRWHNPLKGFGMGVTSLATRRSGNSTVAQQAAAAEATTAAVATSAAAAS